MNGQVLGHADCTSELPRSRLQYLGAATSGVAYCTALTGLDWTVQYGPGLGALGDSSTYLLFLPPRLMCAVDPIRYTAPRSVWLRAAKAHETHGLLLTSWRPFSCDERLQESSILHAAPDNHQFDLQSRRQARGAPSSICHPVSTLASRGDIVQLPSSGQLSDQQIPSAPRDEMEVSAKSCPHLATHTPTHTRTHTHTHTRTRWPLAAGRWEPHGEADSLTYCALSRYRPRLGWCL